MVSLKIVQPVTITVINVVPLESLIVLNVKVIIEKI